MTWGGATDATSGIAGYSIVWDNVARTLPDSSIEWDVNFSQSFSPILLDGNTHYFHIRAIDVAGNGNATGTDLGPFAIDTVPPDAPTLTLSIPGPYTNTTPIAVGVKVDDTGSGVTNISVSTDGRTWDPWIPKRAALSVTPHGPDGQKEIWVRARDAAGNVGPPAKVGIGLDRAPPDIRSVVLAGGVAATRNTSVPLDVDAVDALSGIADMSLSVDGESWDSWRAFAANSSVQLAVPDGRKDVWIRLRDRAGNLAPPTTTGLVLDTHPPVDVALTINDRAAVTDVPTVHLKLAARDEGTGVATYAIREDETDWSAWAPWVTERAWNLRAGLGPRTIQIRVQDAVGNVAEPVEAGIILGRIAITSPNSTRSVQGVVTVRGTVSGGPQWDSVEVRFDGGAWKEVEVAPDGTWSYRWNSGRTQPGSHVIEARVQMQSESLMSQPLTVRVRPVDAGPGGAIAAGGLVLLLLVGVLLYLFWWRKRPKEAGPVPTRLPVIGRRPGTKGAPGGGPADPPYGSRPR